MTQMIVGRDGATASAAPKAASQSANVWVWGAAGLAMMLMLLSPALWNGFPLVFPDTGGYLTRPIEGTLAMGRSALYGWFLYSGVPLAFWPVIIAQAALTVWVIVLTLRCHGLGGRPFLAVVLTATLSLLTSLPWFAAQLMPDILFPAAVLALHLLIFRTAQLSTVERLGLTALVAVTIASHMAALALTLGVLTLIWLATRIKWLSLPKPRLTLAASAASAGVALCLLSNLLITGSLAFTPGGSSFLFARLVEDGIAGRYLKEHCPEVRLRVCAYANELPEKGDDWLWANDTPFYKLGGWEGFGPEARHVALESLRLYPWTHVKAAAAATLKQFVSFKTEVSIHDNHPIYDAIRDHTPALLPAYTASRQHAEQFDISLLNFIHVPIGALALAMLMVAPFLRGRLKPSPDILALCLTVLAALVINAAIAGVFSQPVGRYQSRLMPLALLAVLIMAVGQREHPRLEDAVR